MSIARYNAANSKVGVVLCETLLKQMADEQAALRLDSLRQQLGLTPDELPNDIPGALNTLLVGATKEAEPRYTLQSVHQAILQNDLAPEIDAFTAIPLLFESSIDASDELLTSIAEQCSAKEIVIALQEVSEKLRNGFCTATENEEEDSEVDEPIGQSGQRVIRILSLYSKVIPRLSKGKKTPSQIIHSPMAQLERLLLAAEFSTPQKEVDALLRALNTLIVAAYGWAGEDLGVKDQLYAVALSTLHAYSNKLGTRVAAEAFEEQFPRLRQPSRTASSQLSDSDPVADLCSTLESIGFHPTQLSTPTAPSLTTLLFIAHTPISLASLPSLHETLRSLFPLIIASLRTHTSLPSTLALLLRTLGPLASRNSSASESTEPVPIELLATLSALLPQVASFHPDPLLRHITFRLLSIVLKLTPPLIRMHVLRDLVSDPGQSDDDDEMENGGEGMAVAGVGLVKEFVLAALAQGEEAGEENVFATPMFSEVFVPVLFTLRLPAVAKKCTVDGELEENNEAEDELEAFLGSSEPSRLVEVLGLYWLLVKRDTSTKTGIRAPDVTERIKTNLLDVVKQKLRQWDSIDLEGAEDAKMQLGILDMWLDRIDKALREK